MKAIINKSKIEETRSGCKDIWNAFMCKGAAFTKNDIPYCPTTAKELPNRIVTWVEAKQIYKKSLGKDKDFHCDAFVCFYIDDYKFDGERGIWNRSHSALKILRHFAGVITPDFSTYQDFPAPIKTYNTYRMRVYGYWLGNMGLAVINNVRWGTEESWDYCWDGIPRNTIVSVGTVGGNPKKLIDRSRFETGLYEMVRVLKPHTIIVYGSSNYPCFEAVKAQGIEVVSYPSHTALSFERRKRHE